MDTLAAYAMGQRAKAMGSSIRVFDWDKAAEIIKERKPDVAEAGLAYDYEYTRGTIYQDGKPTDGDGCYLASNWATPTLILDDFDEIECWVIQNNSPGWDSDTVWPESAIKILEAKE